MDKYYVYVGSWASPRNPDAKRGLTIGEYDMESGTIRALKHVQEDLNCSMLTYDDKRQVIYSSNERPFTDQGLGGRATAYKVDLHNGDVTKISDVPSFGLVPSFVAYDPLGSFLVLTHHSMGSSIVKTVQDENGEYRIIREYDETSAILYELGQDGSIGRVCDIIKHTGHGGSPDQTNPHMHSVRFTPDGKYLFICDKGNDGYYSYSIDRENKKLVFVDRLDAVSGAAPRYSMFHPKLNVIYFNNESARLLTAATYDENGKLTKLGDWPTTNLRRENPEDKGPGQSDLKISADGKYLYSIIRADHMISVFETDPETGIPKLIQEIPSSGSGQERDLCFSPDGRFLFLCGCSNGNVYRYIVGEDGRLSDLTLVLEDVAPGALIFVKAEK